MTLTSVLPAADKRPGIWIRTSLGVGPTGAGASPRTICLAGNKTSAGTATVATRYLVGGVDDAKTLFGAGSELAVALEALFDVYESVTVYAIAVAESGGTAATGTLTATGTATADGTIEVTYCGKTVSVPIASGTTQNNVAAALEVALEDMTDWPLDKSTSMASTNVCTVTFVHKGPRGNRASLRVVSNTPGVAMAGPATGYLTSGATADSSQAALDAIAPLRHHYIVAATDGEAASATPDTTDLARYRTFAQLYDDPDYGRRTQVLFGFGGTIADAVTVATGMNASRMQMVWQRDPEQLPLTLAAVMAGVRAKYESADPGVNLDGLVLAGIARTYSDAKLPTAANLVAALNNGVTPLVAINGQMTIGRSITTRSQDASSNPNYAVLDTTKVTVIDFIADDHEIGLAAEFGAHDDTPGFKAGDDDPSGEPPPENVLTPEMLRAWLINRDSEHEEAGLLEPGSVARQAALYKTELSKTVPGRFNYATPYDVIEGAHQFCGDLRQVA